MTKVDVNTRNTRWNQGKSTVVNAKPDPHEELYEKLNTK